MTSSEWWDFTTGDLPRDRANLRVVMETVGELYGLLDVGERMRRAVDRALVLTGAERGILLLDSDRDGDGVPAPYVARDREGRDLDPATLKFSRTAVKTARESGKLYRNIMPADEVEQDLTKSVIDLSLLSVMAAPLDYEDRHLGILYLDATFRPDTPFTEMEEKVFRTLGGLIAAALENARLERVRAEKDRMERQIQNARDVQLRLVPRELPHAAGVDLAGLGRVCEAMSGDYYDAIPCQDGSLGLVVGDVSGHGISQALYMAMTRALMHLLLEQSDDPGATLDRLNVFLEADMPAGMFMSLFLGRYEPGSRRFVYASGGHNPPLLWRKGEDLTDLDPTGPVLGMFPDVTFKASSPLRLASGDVLLLYTDGLTEARAPDHEMYGEERLRASFDEHARRGHGAEIILGGVIGDLDRFRGDRPLEDDITALVLKVVD